jgi:hypothetical protein
MQSRSGGVYLQFMALLAASCVVATAAQASAPELSVQHHPAIAAAARWH